MSANELYPLTFSPVFKDYIWGGRNLERLGREIPDGIIAESWEIAAHKDGESTVTNGPLMGMTLSDVQAKYGLDLIGTRNAWAHERGLFPLLIKVLDANRELSVQVHPDDDYALEHEGNELGKTEMWVVLHAEPDAEVILGVKNNAKPESFRAAITAGNLEQYLHRIPVKAGDHICVPAGSLHAIMNGLMIAEIQQNSNTTYRVYDWNRVGTDGQPRPLHIDKALDVINFEQTEPSLCDPTEISNDGAVARYELCRNRYFVTERVTLKPGASISGDLTGETLEIWGVLEGSVTLNELALDAVQFSLLPAKLGTYTVTSERGATLLRSYTP